MCLSRTSIDTIKYLYFCIYSILFKTQLYKYNIISNLIKLQDAIRSIQDNSKILNNVVYIVDLVELLNRRAICCRIVED